MRPILCLSLLLLLAGFAHAQTAYHTLVVRGRTLAPDGTPISGARVITRGSVSASSLSDLQGRWSLTAPMGSAAALAREPFTLEVRAETDGRRLLLAAGGSALLLDVSLVQRDGRALVRARSNQPSAAAGVATAFAQDGNVNAWIEADFGGASRAGTNDLRFVEEALVPGLVPPAGTRAAGPPPPRAGGKPSSPRATAPAPVAPPPARASAETSRTQPVREKPAPARVDTRRADSVAAVQRVAEAAAKRRADSTAAARRALDLAGRRHADSMLTVRREERRAASRRYDSLAAQRASIRTQDSLAWIAQRARRNEERTRERASEQARLDSLAQWRRERRRADSLEWVARHATTPVRTPVPAAPNPRVERAPAPVATPSVPPVAIPTGTGRPAHAVVPAPAEASDSLRAAPAETFVVGVLPASPDTARAPGSASAVSGERVRRIEPFAPPPPVHVAPDSCVCRLRGTVEVTWPDRPQEQRIPVSVTLSGPVTATRRVELFMGPPREFRFGPMPCGDYRVAVKAQGRLRYGLVTGERDLIVRCEGTGEIRLVLEPQRR